jgi:hypothetical protein
MKRLLTKMFLLCILYNRSSGSEWAEFPQRQGNHQSEQRQELCANCICNCKKYGYKKTKP